MNQQPHYSPTSQPHPLTPGHVQPHGLPHHHQQAPTSHHTQQPSSPHHSMGYGSSSHTTNQDFQLPTPNDVYGVSYPDAEHDVHNLGMNQNSNPNSVSEPAMEPESYYKSEPENRRISSAHSQQHYSPSIAPQSHQSQSQQTPSHFSPSLQPKRESDGGNPTESSGLAPEIGGGRRRSFTVPSGYGAGVSS